MLGKFIAAINKLQDVFNTLSIDSRNLLNNLPQIVMVGAQVSLKNNLK